MRSEVDGRLVGQPTQIEDALARIATTGPDECVAWRGTVGWLGYGQAWFKGRKYKAHRLTYELVVGPIPEGLVIDHLCRNPICVNPAHLEPVTSRENTLRGVGPAPARAAQTHCKRGHALTEDNVYLKGPHKTRRNCRKCTLARNSTPEALAAKRERRRRQRAADDQ